MVSDPTKRGIDTASAIKNLAEKLQINVRRIYLVVNKVTEAEDVQHVLPEDSKAVVAVKGIFGRFGEVECFGLVPLGIVRCYYEC